MNKRGKNKIIVTSSLPAWCEEHRAESLIHKQLQVFVCICRQPDGDALFELRRCYCEQTKPHMSLPEGQRVNSSASGVNTHTHTDKHVWFVSQSLCVLFNRCCLFTVQCTWPRCCWCPHSCGQAAKVGCSMFTILSFIFSGPFLRPTLDCKHVLDELCRPAVD